MFYFLFFRKPSTSLARQYEAMLESEIRPFLLKRAPTDRVQYTQSKLMYTEFTWSTVSHQKFHCPPTSPADKLPEPNTETFGTQLEFFLVSTKSGEYFEHCGTRVRLANTIQQAADITAVAEGLRFYIVKITWHWILINTLCYTSYEVLFITKVSRRKISTARPCLVRIFFTTSP